MNKTKISKIGRRGKIGLAVLVAIMFIGIASAAVIPYFGQIKTIAIVDQQAVEIGVGNPIQWHPFYNPVEHTIPHSSPGGETFCFKQWVRNKASIPVDITFERTDDYIDEVTTKIYAPSPTTTLILENKNPADWSIIVDTTQATLTFDTVSPTFNYQLTATGLTPTTEYALIYYADYEDRYNNWGGDNPGAVIDTFTTDTSGDCSQSNNVELNRNLPSSPDANIDIHDYSGTPDFYTHGHGAKIWIVPTSDLTSGGILPVVNWKPDAFLFETDLIIYLDCNEPVNDYFCRLLGEEVTEPITVQSGQMIPILICYTFDLHIGIGTYNLITRVDATEHI